MSYEPHFIANFDENGGLNRAVEPFLIPEKAFPELEDAYAWRGRIKRREGFEHLGRLRRVVLASALGNTGATPWAFNIFTILLTGEPNAEIQAGSVTITLNGAIVFTDNADGTLSSVTAGNSGTINYITGAVVLTHTAGAGVPAVLTSFAYYPGLPVMGLPRQEIDALNNEPMIAFDTKYAYHFIGGQFERLGTAAWTGTNSEFFWSVNYYKNANGKLFWTTNFHLGATPDPIRYWDTTTWTNFAPILRADNAATPTKLLQTLALIPYKDRLLAFNTYEGDTTTVMTQYPQRMRWSQLGTPTEQGTVAAGPVWTVVSAWADDKPGFGGFVDAPTSEQIVSVGFIKDVLVVKFERSSWRVVYTGNEVLPFVFEKVNTELGAESTFSLVGFDRGIFAVGNYGVTVDDGINVQRIDPQIPQVVFNINNDNEGIYRVHGIRDFTRELVYWTYPDQKFNPTFPNKVLVYNYKNNTYAIYNDSFTCFGFYLRQIDIPWNQLPYPSWTAWNKPWGSGQNQSLYPDIAAGNQQGYVSILGRQVPNDVSLTIKAIDTAVNPNVFTILNHNLQSDQYVKITGILSVGAPDLTVLNDNVYLVTRIDADTISLQDSNYANVAIGAGATYLGGGKLTVLNNISVTTKVFSPFYESGQQTRLGYVDFFLDRTADGEITANIFVDENDTEGMNDPNLSTGTSGNLGTNVLLTRPENLTLLPFQVYQAKIWHRVYVQVNCQNFEIWLTMNDAQMFDETINSSDFVLHAMTLYLSPNARMTQ